MNILTDSCCAREDIQKRIESVLQKLQPEIPELKWKVADIVEEPELVAKNQIVMTPAILIDGKLEFVGFPKQAALEGRIRGRVQT